MSATNWTTDWSAFVESVRLAWDAGLSENEVTRQHAHRRMRWTGTVIDLKRFQDAISVAVRMSDTHFQLRNGKRGHANYVALNVLPENAEEWQRVRSGDRLVFETEIDMASPDDPFTKSGIQWSDLGENAGYFKLLTRDSRLTEFVNTPSTA